MKKNILLIFIALIIFTPQFLSAQVNSKLKSDYFEYLKVDKSDIRRIENSITSEKSASLNMAVNNQDSLALVDLYNSTGGTNWTEDYNWLTAKSVYYWKGIEIENNRVIIINLNENNLTETIPSSIGNLTALTSLNLSENNLSGSTLLNM